MLVHGWGFHAGLWRELVGHLPNAEITLVDLGFVRGGPRGAKSWPDNAIAIGHSLGAMWLLHEAASGTNPGFRGLISIQGFDRFCPHVPPAKIIAMRRGLRREPAATLTTFWRSCGTEPFAAADALDVERLDQGLGWLLDWDMSVTRSSLACPSLALAARNDAIVPPAMSAAIWDSSILHWSQSGGHVLPLQEPQWCANHVLDFARRLEP